MGACGRWRKEFPRFPPFLHDAGERPQGQSTQMKLPFWRAALMTSRLSLFYAPSCFGLSEAEIRVALAPRAPIPILESQAPPTTK
jgi:hypothetical protein